MEGLIIGIILVLAIGGFIAYRLWTKKSNELEEEIEMAYQRNGIPKTRRNFKYSGTSPGGVKWRSTVPVPAAALEQVEQGFRTEIEIANITPGYEAWTEAKSISGVRVDFIDPTGVNVENDPGSPYTNVGPHQTAGTVIGMNEGTEELKNDPIIVFPHQQDQNWQFLDYLYRTAWYEFEHYGEFKRRFQEPQHLWRRYAIDADIHPHRPNPRMSGFKSAKPMPCKVSF